MRRACEAAIAACRKAGLGDDAPANVVYLVLRGLRTGAPEYMDEAADLFRSAANPSRQCPSRTRKV
jgi:hypothetical protein